MSKENYVEMDNQNQEVITEEENNKFEMVEVVKTNKKRIVIGAAIAGVIALATIGAVKLLKGGNGEIVEATADMIGDVVQ